MNTECIEFQGPFNEGGYGQLHIGNELWKAHRLSYRLFKGHIPRELCVDHICRNRKCINPDHLQLLTIAENVLSGVGISAIYKRRTHCKNGHPFIKENIFTKPRSKSGRRCIPCSRLYGKRYWQKQKIQKQEVA